MDRAPLVPRDDFAVIVILANRWDASARELAARWKDHDARVMTARDLSREGWLQRLGHAEKGTVVIDGEVSAQRKIAAVLTRLSSVYPEELGHIVAEDRSYVAAEMNAFLHFWLDSLTCPVINRPAPACLNGPSWRPEQWVSAAARAGFAVEPFWLQPAEMPQEPAPETALTVVGGQCFGAGDPLIQTAALRLARLAGVALLGVRLHGTRFRGVELVPDISQEAIANAVLEAVALVAQTAR